MFVVELDFSLFLPFLLGPPLVGFRSEDSHDFSGLTTHYQAELMKFDHP